LFFSQSKRNSTVGVSRKARRSCAAISDADAAATTAQMRATPLPNRPILPLFVVARSGLFRAK
jgi:hypothetical protein